MNLRPFGSIVAFALSAAAIGGFTGYSSSAFAAGEKDKDALKLHDAALDEDYLNLELDKAEKKLKDALKKCGDGGCSPNVVAKLHMGLGTVLGGGRQNLDGARDEFVLALKADPSAKLNESYTTPELADAFKKAKEIAKASKPNKPDDGGGGDGGSDGSDKPKTGGDLTHTPPTEQAVNTPVPVYIEVPEDVTVANVKLKYKPFGATKWQTVDMNRIGKGWGAEIPCTDVTTTGDVKYYIIVTDEAGEQLKAGTQKEPHRVAIKHEIEGDEPSFPGKKPPTQCEDKSSCPPGLPGCDAKGGEKRGDKGWGSSCDADRECQTGLICQNGQCEEGQRKSDDGKSSGKKNIVGVGAQLDVMWVGTADNVCSGEKDNYYCFYEGTSNRFFGDPIVKEGTNGVQSGFAVGGGRAFASYDREITKAGKGAFGLGVKVGVAFGGHPDSTTAPPAWPSAHGRNPHLPIVSFPPLHLEARAYYSFAGNTFEQGALRPYGFLGGGFAKVSASVPVTVCDSLSVDGKSDVSVADRNPDCSNVVNAKDRKLDAYQISGLNFISFGAGMTYGITPTFGINAELKFMVMVTTVAFVVSPSVGPVFAF
ncbi:MAG TPA: hypothetical protein PK156_22795 [Polyangium sp.]|nr:hypothetical protein [Polyangium sp.]